MKNYRKSMDKQILVLSEFCECGGCFK